MSTTQELEAAEALIAEYLTVITRQAAELDALRGMLAGVHRFAEHIAKQPLAEQARKDHEDEGHDGEPDFEGAYDAIIEQARAAIAAYLAAVGGK